jgi:hypothetical protein
VWVQAVPEHGCKNPVNGRRLHLVVPLADATDAELGSVVLNGEQLLNLDTSSTADISTLHWARVHMNANPKTAARVLWISLHTSNLTWLGLGAGTDGGDHPTAHLTVAVAAQNGTMLFSGKVDVPAVEGGLQLTSFATRAGGAEAVLHLHNAGDDTRQLMSVAVDGAEVAVKPAAKTVPPGGHVVLVAKFPVPKVIGEVWTVRLVQSGRGAGADDPLPPSGYGGRTPPERFPVMVWPHSTDCPLPGVSDANYQQLETMGVDSIFYTGEDFGKSCGSLNPQPLSEYISKLSNTSQVHLFTDPSVATGITPAAKLASRVDAVFVGDEVDGDVDAEHLRNGALRGAIAAYAAAPGVLSYQGSKTVRNVGAFAGITDVQGADAYSAACAPTLAAAMWPLPVDYSLLYLRNARDNTVPQPMWGYAQLYSDAWSYQANSYELVAQIGQAVLAGSKALMLFQSEQSQFEQHDVQSLATAIQGVKTVGEVLRLGDVDAVGVAVSGGKALVQAIRSPDQLVVAVVNANAHGYSNLLCHTQVVDRHWNYRAESVDVALNMSKAPDVTRLGNWREAIGDELGPVHGGVKIEVDGATIMLRGIALDATGPQLMRLLVADVQQ